VLAVVPAGEGRVWNETVIARLVELRPEVYGGWEPEQLTAALKPHGVTVGQIWGTDPASGKGANRRGITRAQVAEAADRLRRRALGPPPDDRGPPAGG
jgi:S-DNA-T family DNA segregation ATPase FtsK/SpoIIIE